MSFDEKIFGWIHRRVTAASSKADHDNQRLWRDDLRALSRLGSALFESQMNVVGDVEFKISTSQNLYVRSPDVSYSRYAATRFARLKLLFQIAILKKPELKELAEVRSLTEPEQARRLWNSALHSLVPVLPAVCSWIEEVENELNFHAPEHLRNWRRWKDWTLAFDFSDSRRRLQYPSLVHAGLQNNRDELSNLSVTRANSVSEYKSASLEMEANPEIKIVKLRPENQNPLFHVFEKLLTADSYKAGSKPIDSTDELKEQAEALKELKVDQLVRVSGTAESGVSLEINSEFGADGKGQNNSLYDYDEWFATEGAFRKDWCRVHEFTYPESTLHDGVKSSRFASLTRELESIFQSRVWVNRRPEGQEVDIDQIVRCHAEPFGGGSAHERFYIERLRRQKDFGILLLSDFSASTDSYVQNRRVFDEIKQFLMWLTGSLKDCSKSFGVAAFASDSRLKCSFGWLKKFDEDLSVLEPRLQGCKPLGYTRIGPALRHARNALLSQSVRKRSLILLTDGKPTDYDRYEGRHGRADVKKAISEILKAEIRFRSYTFAKERRRDICETFGAGSFQTVQSAGGLAKLLVQDLRELIST